MQQIHLEKQRTTKAQAIYSKLDKDFIKKVKRDSQYAEREDPVRDVLDSEEQISAVCILADLLKAIKRDLKTLKGETNDNKD